jgi:hypothetical protein
MHWKNAHHVSSSFKTYDNIPEPQIKGDASPPFHPVMWTDVSGKSILFEQKTTDDVRKPRTVILQDHRSAYKEVTKQYKMEILLSWLVTQCSHAGCY